VSCFRRVSGSFDVAQEFTVGDIQNGLQFRRKTSALLHFQAPNVNSNATSGLSKVIGTTEFATPGRSTVGTGIE